MLKTPDDTVIKIHLLLEGLFAISVPVIEDRASFSRNHSKQETLNINRV